tara:strand:- start:200 stop:772 length:573 start_codon:yes stop_codon:yes gene_type:complete
MFYVCQKGGTNKQTKGNTMYIDVTISNTHERGFAFAIADNGDQMFIPPHVADGHGLQRGGTIIAQAAINPSEIQRANTKWVALNLVSERPAAAEVQLAAEPEVEVPPTETLSIEQRDELVYGFISDGAYATTAEISRCTGLDHKTAGNSALRLFNSGLIAKADVYNRVGQQRSTVTLWADSAASFLGDDQ